MTAAIAVGLNECTCVTEDIIVIGHIADSCSFVCACNVMYHLHIVIISSLHVSNVVCFALPEGDWFRIN